MVDPRRSQKNQLCAWRMGPQFLDEKMQMLQYEHPSSVAQISAPHRLYQQLFKVKATSAGFELDRFQTSTLISCPD